MDSFTLDSLHNRLRTGSWRNMLTSIPDLSEPKIDCGLLKPQFLLPLWLLAHQEKINQTVSFYALQFTVAYSKSFFSLMSLGAIGSYAFKSWTSLCKDFIKHEEKILLLWVDPLCYSFSPHHAYHTSVQPIFSYQEVFIEPLYVEARRRSWCGKAWFHHLQHTYWC